MLAPTMPNSKQGEIFLINLASDVPPDVDNLVFILVFFLTIFLIIYITSLGLVINGSPEVVYSTLNLHLCFLQISLIQVCNFFLSELELCLSLNLILKVANASPGITLSAVLFIFIFVISKFEG